jgi:hypothetical protein
MVWGDDAGKWGLMVASPGMYFTARGAFEKHASQVVWDRYDSIERRSLWKMDIYGLESIYVCE